MTALLEVQALVWIPGIAFPLRTAPWTLVTVDGIVSNVLDLTAASVVDALGTNGEEMTGPWVTRADAPTQELGRVAYGSEGIAAIKYGSAKKSGGMNLVVFPERLAPQSTDFLEVFDPHGNLSQRIGA